MDPVTTAIVAAIAAGVGAGTTEVSKQALIDAYNVLKHKLKQFFGEDSKLANAVDELEQDPDSEGRKLILKEQVAKTQADQNPELLASAQVLLDQLKAQPGGEQHIQNAIGHHIAQADRGGRATVITKGDQEPG